MNCPSCRLSYEGPETTCHNCAASLNAAPIAADSLQLQVEDSLQVKDSMDNILAYPGFMPRFIGRDDLLAKLEKSLLRMKNTGRVSPVCLSSKSGLGKSRVVSEFGDLLARHYPEVRLIRGVETDHATKYSAFVQILRKRFDINKADTPDEAQKKLLSTVTATVPKREASKLSHLLACLMGISFPLSPVTAPLQQTPLQLEAQMFLALRRFFAADSANRPLVLVLEDLELCGPSTINLLSYLVAGLPVSQVMILTTIDEEIEPLQEEFSQTDTPFEKIHLAPLSPSETEALVCEVCRCVVEVPDILVKHAISLGGCPGSVLELIRLLLESRILIQTERNLWSIDQKKLTNTKLPTNKMELIQARLQLLSTTEKDLLHRAAVVGERFWLDTVVSLIRTSPMGGAPPLTEIAQSTDLTQKRVQTTIANLIHRGWIVQAPQSILHGERDYRFASRNVWCAIYDDAPETIRRQCHHFVAQWLLLRPKSKISQEQIGRHFELAGAHRIAANHYREAATDAHAEFHNNKAIQLYERALRCLDESHYATRIQCLHDLGRIHLLRGNYKSAMTGFEHMLRLAWVAESKSKSAVALNEIGRIWRVWGRFGNADDYFRRGLDLFHEAGDSCGVASSYDDMGTVLLLQGHYADAHVLLEKALSIPNRIPRSRAHSLATLGRIEQARGNLSQAQKLYEQARKLFQSADDHLGDTETQIHLALLALRKECLNQAQEELRISLTNAERFGALPLQVRALAGLGELAIAQGRADEARGRLEDAVSLATTMHDCATLSEASRNLAILENSLGSPERARELAGTAHELASSAGMRASEGRALVTLGQILSKNLFDPDAPEQVDESGTHRQSAAETYFDAGMTLLQDLGNRPSLAVSLEAYGRYKIEHNDLHEGVTMLREALKIFKQLGIDRGQEIQQLLIHVH